MMYELAKLGTEVQQLRQVIERRSCDRYKAGKGAVIPQLERGPVSTIADYKSLQQRCADTESQSALVLFFFSFLPVVLSCAVPWLHLVFTKQFIQPGWAVSLSFCFFRLHDLSLCWCMFCFTLNSCVISLHVLALA